MPPSNPSLPRLPPRHFPPLSTHQAFPTATSITQKNLERELIHHTTTTNPTCEILRETHTNYFLKALKPLPQIYQSSLYASQPWLLFWSLNSLDLLDTLPTDDIFRQCIKKFLGSCFDEDYGGYGGGPGQVAHLAATYASVMTLCIIGEMDSVDVGKVIGFVRRMKDWKSGGFSVSENGEADVRGLYFAVVVGRLLGVGVDDEIWEGCEGFVRNLQAFDGGLGGDFGNEGHGGYTYCGVASLELLGLLEKGRGIDVGLVREWGVFRQMGFEGGFQGRCNKLVDACYSFWVAATLQILRVKFDGSLLLDYLLRFSQDEEGGMRDKPQLKRDYYHSCYGLCGVSLAQHWGDAKNIAGKQDRVKKLNVLFCLCEDTAENALGFFKKKSQSSKR